MRFHIGLPIFLLLAAPPASAGEPETLVRAGRLEIDLDPEAVSFLPIDLEKLQARLCEGNLPDTGEPLDPTGECVLSVSPSPFLVLVVDEVSPLMAPVVGDVGPLGGALRAAVQLRDLTPWLGSEPITTDCGLWDVSMVLDPDAAQPLSELALEPSVADPPQGAFAGVVKLAVRYRFANRDTGISSELPTLRSLELAGHWAAIPEGDPGLTDGASNLRLFAGFFAGEWLDVPACGAWGGLRCPVCLRPPPEALERLNAGLGR